MTARHPRGVVRAAPTQVTQAHAPDHAPFAQGRRLLEEGWHRMRPPPTREEAAAMIAA